MNGQLERPVSGHDTLLYRCPECGHGRNLYAYAELSVRGRVLDDGYIDTSNIDVIDSDGPHDIECSEHPDVVIERGWRERGTWHPIAR